jgi:hypothetical protein
VSASFRQTESQNNDLRLEVHGFDIRKGTNKPNIYTGRNGREISISTAPKTAKILQPASANAVEELVFVPA